MGTKSYEIKWNKSDDVPRCDSHLARPSHVTGAFLEGVVRMPVVPEAFQGIMGASLISACLGDQSVKEHALLARDRYTPCGFCEGYHHYTAYCPEEANEYYSEKYDTQYPEPAQTAEERARDDHFYADPADLPF